MRVFITLLVWLYEHRASYQNSESCLRILHLIISNDKNMFFTCKHLFLLWVCHHHQTHTQCTLLFILTCGLNVSARSDWVKWAYLFTLLEPVPILNDSQDPLRKFGKQCFPQLCVLLGQHFLELVRLSEQGCGFLFPLAYSLILNLQLDLTC